MEDVGRLSAVPGKIAAALALTVLVQGVGPSFAAFTCATTGGGGCPLPGSTCFVDCTEADLRAVLQLINGCPTNTTAEDITVALGPDAGTTCGSTPIAMAMVATHPATATGSCGDDNTNRYNALCLNNTGVVVDGRGAILTYSGDHICASCDGECTLCSAGPCSNRQPALFVLRGNRNTVRNLEMRFFPEGMDIKAGDAHTIEGVTDRFICENALTVSSGSGHRIRANTLIGNTQASGGGGTCYQRREGSTCASDADCVTAGARCYCGQLSTLGSCASPPPPPLWPAATPGQCFLPRPCGLDKAIELNSGTTTIGGDDPADGNAIHMISQPVHVGAGTHTIANNLTCGHHTDRNVCQAYDVSGGSATLRRNRIDHCKFGVRAVGAGQIDASENTITNGYASAFQVKGAGAGRLKAASNRMRNNGYATGTDCQRGALVVDNPAATVDFGGGDFSGAAVLGGTVSAGANVFCQGSLNHVWNVTDCPCSLMSSCSCTLDGLSCGSGCGLPAGPCCHLETDGACTGSTGGDASVGIGIAEGALNAFDSPPILAPVTMPNVVDRLPVRTRVENALAYPYCAAVVVDPCECLFETDGTECTDGNECTTPDACAGGTCVSGAPVVCNPLDQCHDAGTCDPFTGSCSNPAKTNGTACDDDDACTQTDACTAGTCVGGNPVVCSALDQCHDAGTCDPSTGTCSNPPKTDGTTCDAHTDTQCSEGDTCQSGACTPGGGGDSDGDGLCDADDDCPTDANADQLDLDGDGIGNVCDPEDATLTAVSIRVQRRRKAGRVSAVAQARFTLRATGDRFDPTGGLLLRLRDQGGQELTASWGVAECQTSSRAVTTCASADGRLRLRVHAVGRGRYRLRSSLRDLVATGALVRPFTLTLREAGAIDRAGRTGRSSS